MVEGTLVFVFVFGVFEVFEVQTVLVGVECPDFEWIRVRLEQYLIYLSAHHD